MHNLFTRTFLFMEMYYLKSFYEGAELLAADSKILINVMKTISIKNPQGRPSSEENNIKKSKEVILSRKYGLGLVKYKECHVLWNREVNAASNIYKIAKNALNGLERPAYLSRGQYQ